MVSTRRSTNSLPDKKASYAEEQAAENEAAKHVAAHVKPKRSGVKRKTQQNAKVNDSGTAVNDTTELLRATSHRRKGQRNKKAPVIASAPVTLAPPRDGATGFLDLPPEIRNEIYSYALVQLHAILILSKGTFGRPYLSEPTLVKVSRQVRSEALSIFYNENTFAIDGSSPAMKFLRSLTDQKLRALRALYIRGTLGPAVDTIEYAFERISHHQKEFGRRGLDRQTLRFHVRNVDGQMIWANRDQLRQLAAG